MKNWLLYVFAVMTIGASQCAWTQDKLQCPGFLDQEFKLLHSSKTINLCSLYQGKPMLIVNTASHCGYTKQFKPLEALYQKYKDKGFQIIGFTSNDFKQAAKSEEEAAEICYKNYGVTFTMLSPTKVTGQEANPVFAYLTKQSGEQPQWNFNKYLVSADGRMVSHFSQKEEPLGGAMEEAIVKALEK